MPGGAHWEGGHRQTQQPKRSPEQQLQVQPLVAAVLGEEQGSMDKLHPTSAMNLR